MNLDMPERTAGRLTVLRIVRGLLVTSLSPVFVALANFYLAHQTIIHGMPVFDPTVVIFYSPLVFMSFGIGIGQTILEIGYMIGVHEESNLSLPAMIVSLIFEFIMISIVLVLGASGALIVQGYRTFMYLATSQFLLFVVLVLAETYMIHR